ncbi:MAG: hypothetical protein ABF459_12765, partial [Gluconobacter cerinus]|uniref:hypothetical protein n=1 Tax=Gluconobacter cerinus TaxID=38307 RepID=UPI0039E8E104
SEKRVYLGKSNFRGHVDKRPDPEAFGGDIEETQEGQGGLVIVVRDTGHLLEPVGHPLDSVAVPLG